MFQWIAAIRAASLKIAGPGAVFVSSFGSAEACAILRTAEVDGQVWVARSSSPPDAEMPMFYRYYGKVLPADGAEAV